MQESPPPSPANRITRRLGCLAGVLVWLVVMILPIFIFVLVTNGQIEWGEDPQDQMRLFLLQDVDQEGVGFQWTRPHPSESSCLETTVAYLMFSGEAENGRSCTCLADTAGRPVPDGYNYHYVTITDSGRKRRI